MWTLAPTSCPTEGLVATNYGWTEEGGVLQPYWFAGPALPEELFGESSSGTGMDDEYASDSEDGGWSEDSENSDFE